MTTEGGSGRIGTVFVPGGDAALARMVQEAALLPEGSLMFHLEPKQLYEQPGSVTLLHVATGATLLGLTRTEAQVLTFTHAAPGTGTRVAQLALPPLVDDGVFLVAMTWSESETALYAGFLGREPGRAAGMPSPTQIRVVDGEVLQLGDADLEVMGYQIFVGGELQLRESGIEVWESTKRAIDIHLRSEAVEGYVGEVIQSNLALVMMATGVETYCGRRFVELPAEGRTADVEAMAKAVLPTKIRESGQFASVVDVLDARQVDFGNYKASSEAFRATYGLRFASDLGLSEKTLESVRRMLEYRHRIAHVSPLIALLNQARVPPDAPVFAGHVLVSELLQATDSFVAALHAATLRLR
jgi:hypothetical protein